MTSIAAAIDPDMQRLVRLERPRRTAVSLVATMTAIAAAVLVQLAAPAVALFQDLINQPGPMAARLLAAGWAAASVLLLAAAIASIGIAPDRDSLLRAEWGRRRVGLQLGLVLWAIAAVAVPLGFGWRAPDHFPDPFLIIISNAWQLLCALAPLGGLRSIFMILGRRSRRWREARHGRQGIDALVAAAGGVLVFSTAVPIMAAYRFEALHTLAVFLTVASAAVLSIGVLYLVANAMWIARSLVKPPLPLDAFV